MMPMSAWNDELGGLTLKEVWERQAQNRAWGKEIRQKMADLVNRRLAKVITQMDYDSQRKEFENDVREWRRRTSIVNQRIVDETRSKPATLPTT